MQSSSSTSNFEFGPSEQVPRRKVPWAALAVLLCIFLMERALDANRQWFADEAVWQWEAKQTLAAEGRLDGRVVILGSSVLFHGLDPTPANEISPADRQAANLALNGMLMQHRAQELRDRLKSGSNIDTVVLETRKLLVPRESWIGGPYFRRAASWDDILESRLYYWQPSLLLNFDANRILPSYCYRRGLDNWIFACLKSGGLSRSVFERNAEKVRMMSQQGGFAPFGEETALNEQDVPQPCQRPWRVDFAADLWMHDLLDTCRQHQLSVVFCCPPVPPFAERDRVRSGYYPAREEYLAKLRSEFPTVDFTLFAPKGYTLEMFSDDHHFSRAGRIRLSEDFATWLEEARR